MGVFRKEHCIAGLFDAPRIGNRQPAGNDGRWPVFRTILSECLRISRESSGPPEKKIWLSPELLPDPLLRFIDVIAQDYFEHILRFGIKSNKESSLPGIIPGMAFWEKFSEVFLENSLILHRRGRSACCGK